MTKRRRRRLRVGRRDGWSCHWCGIIMVERMERTGPPARTDPTLDHVVPLSHGGADTDENLVLACYTCNSRRSHAATPDGPPPVLPATARERRAARLTRKHASQLSRGRQPYVGWRAHEQE